MIEIFTHCFNHFNQMTDHTVHIKKTSLFFFFLATVHFFFVL